ncbi:MAG: POT family MFS transporter [Methylococcales symbiont of Iophon sp. n. MRB-2018]|nr:MAG: POT family MFS transporter [Methylococcales symbiont of Iophon sp. n. MRB-2018]KAF3979026.1 MAG: POT family MFS transporter [Methylococcales symbiont of Iophon sp. n. MRB-2018]
MRAILVVFITQYLVSPNDELDAISDNEVQGYYHLFISAVYFMPILGFLLY